jgi:hypothetical protein
VRFLCEARPILTVQNDHGQLVDAELVPRDHLESFFERAIPSWQDDEPARGDLRHLELSLSAVQRDPRSNVRDRSRFPLTSCIEPTTSMDNLPSTSSSSRSLPTPSLLFRSVPVPGAGVPEEAVEDGVGVCSDARDISARGTMPWT